MGTPNSVLTGNEMAPLVALASAGVLAPRGTMARCARALRGCLLGIAVVAVLSLTSCSRSVDDIVRDLAGDEGTRSRALSDAQKLSGASLGEFVLHLEDDDPQRADAVTEALGTMDGEAAAAIVGYCAMRLYSDDGVAPKREEYRGGPDFATSQAASRAQTALVAIGWPSVAPLLGHSDSGQVRVRLFFLDVLSNLGEHSAPVAEELVTRYLRCDPEDPDDLLYARGVERALAGMGNGAFGAVPLLDGGMRSSIAVAYSTPAPLTPPSSRGALAAIYGSQLREWLSRMPDEFRREQNSVPAIRDVDSPEPLPSFPTSNAPSWVEAPMQLVIGGPGLPDQEVASHLLPESLVLLEHGTPSTLLFLCTSRVRLFAYSDGADALRVDYYVWVVDTSTFDIRDRTKLVGSSPGEFVLRPGGLSDSERLYGGIEGQHPDLLRWLLRAPGIDLALRVEHLCARIEELELWAVDELGGMGPAASAALHSLRKLRDTIAGQEYQTDHDKAFIQAATAAIEATSRAPD